LPTCISPIAEPHKANKDKPKSGTKNIQIKDELEIMYIQTRKE
jgi:hypothetical protein